MAMGGDWEGDWDWASGTESRTEGGGLVDLKENSGFVPREGVGGGEVESNEGEDESTSAPRAGEVQDKTRRDVRLG